MALTRAARRAAQKWRSYNLRWRQTMNLGTILLIVLVLALIGAIPTWPYSSGWGYYPAGGLGLVVLVLLVLLVMGKL
jgi:hypothetical protein